MSISVSSHIKDVGHVTLVLWQIPLYRAIKVKQCFRMKRHHVEVKPSEDERIKFWGLAYARTSLIEATNYIGELKKGAFSTILKDALVTSLIVAYCRLHTEVRIRTGKKVWPLTIAYVPDELHSTHADLISLRNKVFGHKDASEVDSSGIFLNRVLLHSQSGFIDIHTTIPVEMSEDLLYRTELVCKQGLERIEKEMLEFTAKYFAGGLKQGRHEILISEVDGKWIRAIK